MGFIKKLISGFKSEVPDEAIAHPILYEGPAPYGKSLDSECGVVLEDDGETGYFYATNSGNDTVMDALHLYNNNDGDRLQDGEEVFIVWNPKRRRVGLFYHDRFQAVFDFDTRRGACRTGYPPPMDAGWSEGGHDWDENLTTGLNPA